MDAAYEDVLHEEAQLSTTPDIFKSGCAIQPQLDSDRGPAS